MYAYVVYILFMYPIKSKLFLFFFFWFCVLFSNRKQKDYNRKLNVMRSFNSLVFFVLFCFVLNQKIIFLSLPRSLYDTYFLHNLVLILSFEMCWLCVFKKKSIKFMMRDDAIMQYANNFQK